MKFLHIIHSDFKLRITIYLFIWLIYLFKYVLIYKVFINVVYSPWGLLSISMTGSFFEPFSYKVYEKMNRKIIKVINSNNPETIQNWSQELARQEAYDFSPIPSPTNSANVELEEISVEFFVPQYSPGIKFSRLKRSILFFLEIKRISFLNLPYSSISYGTFTSFLNGTI